MRVGAQVLVGSEEHLTEYDPRREYILMAAAGLSPMQVLASLTTAPAASCAAATRWACAAFRARSSCGAWHRAPAGASSAASPHGGGGGTPSPRPAPALGVVSRSLAEDECFRPGSSGASGNSCYLGGGLLNSRARGVQTERAVEEWPLDSRSNAGRADFPLFHSRWNLLGGLAQKPPA